MGEKIEANKIYALSPDVVAREIQGEFIIIPITSGVGDLEDELFSLNETGQAIWKQLDGKKSLQEVSKELALQFAASAKDIEKDISGLVAELLKRRMLVEIKRS